MDIVLILDLDGTMIAEMENDDDNQDKHFVGRPFLEDLFKYAFSTFGHVGIWTAAQPHWFWRAHYLVLRPALKRAGVEKPFSFIWFRDRCTKHLHSPPTKKLAKIWRTFRKRGYNRHNTIIIDDKPATFVHNYGNAVFIPTYVVGKNRHNDQWLSRHDDRFIHLIKYFQKHLIPARRHAFSIISTLTTLNIVVLEIINSYVSLWSIRRLNVYLE